MDFLKLLKHLPTLLAVIEAISKMVEAIKSRSQAKKKNQNHEAEDKTIEKSTKKLIDIGDGFLTPEMKAKATKTEIMNFSQKLFLLVDAAVEAVEAFVPLLK